VRLGGGIQRYRADGVSCGVHGVEEFTTARDARWFRRLGVQGHFLGVYSWQRIDTKSLDRVSNLLKT
jgi:hypothetical protein